MGKKMSEPIMLKLKPASEKTGLSYDCLRKMCLNGQIAHIRSGVDYLVNMPELMKYLNTAGKKTEKENK